MLFLSYCHVKTTVEFHHILRISFDMILILEHPRDISRNRGSYFRPVEIHIHKTMSWKGLPCFLRHHGPRNQSGFTYEPTCSLSCPASIQPWIKLSFSLYDPVLSFELPFSLRDSDSNLAFQPFPLKTNSFSDLPAHELARDCSLPSCLSEQLTSWQAQI